MSKDRVLKKKEIIEFTAKLLNAFRHLTIDYQRATGYSERKCTVGDWAIEETYMGRATIESILKITSIDAATGSYVGIDLLGEERSWRNSSFVKLPKSCTDYLNGEYRW